MKADRPSVIWALLGSSVLAALIGAGSSISTAYVTMKASGELEIKKSQLEQSRVEDKATVDSYNGLDKSLNDLRQEFDGVVTLAQIAQSKQGKNGKLPTINLNSQFEHLGVDVGAVLAFKEDPHIDQRVWNKIDKPINQIAIAINSADSNLASISAGAGSIEADLDAAITEERHLRQSVGAERANYGKH